MGFPKHQYFQVITFCLLMNKYASYPDQSINQLDDQCAICFQEINQTCSIWCEPIQQIEKRKYSILSLFCCPKRQKLHPRCGGFFCEKCSQMINQLKQCPYCQRSHILKQYAIDQCRWCKKSKFQITQHSFELCSENFIIQQHNLEEQKMILEEEISKLKFRVKKSLTKQWRMKKIIKTLKKRKLKI